MRILFVAMPGSIHAARWINQLVDQGWDVHLFGSVPGPVHQDLRNVTVYGISAYRPRGLDPSVRVRGVWPFKKGARLFNKPFLQYSSYLLAALIWWLKPDVVHTMEIQHAGYIALGARGVLRRIRPFPTWVVSNWGSDIYLFGRLAEHEERIRAVMSACDFYHTECHRDVGLAKEFGFEGEGSFVLPLAGGFDTGWARGFRQPGPPSERRVVALKGYQGWAYRALVGLRAIEMCADLLKEKGYRVQVYLASPDTLISAELLGRSTGLPIDIIPHGPHEEMLKLHGRSRVSIGLSISDALSTSALETMVMGSFPIQSNTSCIGELLRDGESGILVHPEDPEPIAEAIRRAVTDDELVDRADGINAHATAEFLDSAVVKPRALRMYEEIAAYAASKKP